MGTPCVAVWPSVDAALHHDGSGRLDGLGGPRLAAGRQHTAFIVQLGANALWTWIFFVWHMGAMAMAEILLLWALIVWTIMSFWRVRKVAGALLIPYLLWVSFASVLTYFMWQGNPQIL